MKFICLSSPADCVEQHFDNIEDALRYLAQPFRDQPIQERFKLEVDMRMPGEVTLTYLP